MTQLQTYTKQSSRAARIFSDRTMMELQRIYGHETKLKTKKEEIALWREMKSTRDKKRKKELYDYFYALTVKEILYVVTKIYIYIRIDVDPLDLIMALIHKTLPYILDNYDPDKCRYISWCLIVLKQRAKTECNYLSRCIHRCGGKSQRQYNPTHLYRYDDLEPDTYSTGDVYDVDPAKASLGYVSPDEFSGVLSNNTTPATDLVRQDDDDFLLNKIIKTCNLTPPQIAVLDCRYFAGMSTSQTAKKLKTNKKHVDNMTQAVKRQIRKYMQIDDFKIYE